MQTSSVASAAAPTPRTTIQVAERRNRAAVPRAGEFPSGRSHRNLKAFGTGFLALVGLRLPGLQFRNQRVEAAYRKELVYGEDDPDRADPMTLAESFANVRKNYFVLYFHYMYFNVARFMYLQVDNIFSYVVLGPSIVIGAITLGLMQQVIIALDQIRGSFQYLVNSWTTIVELQSIYKRLRGFEAMIDRRPMDVIEFRPGPA